MNKQKTFERERTAAMGDANFGRVSLINKANIIYLQLLPPFNSFWFYSASRFLSR